jgi:hypothetical protein
MEKADPNLVSPNRKDGGDLLNTFEKIAKIINPGRYLDQHESFSDSVSNFKPIIEDIEETESEIIPEERVDALTENRKSIEESLTNPKRSLSNPRH